MVVAPVPKSMHRSRKLFWNRLIDRSFRWTTLLFALTIPVIIFALVLLLGRFAFPAMHQYRWAFLYTSIWDPVHQHFGVLFAIYGTIISSCLALLIAVPVSLGTAIFLAELAPSWLREPLSFLIELLAAIPSIVYGIWGLLVLVPMLRIVELWLSVHFPTCPLFNGAPYGTGMLAAGIVLAVMILPYITAVSREVIRAVPITQREASLALGATQWETISRPVLRYARTGILGAIILGLGRALGETMAVAMVIGNRADISACIFNPAYTIPSLLANEFAEASDKLHYASLVEGALVLVVLTIIINVIARLLIWSVSGGESQEVHG